MAAIHVAVSISWMGHTNTHTKKKKHDDMLSCCATKKYGSVQGLHSTFRQVYFCFYRLLSLAENKIFGMFIS